MAVAHSILVSIYYMLQRGEPYHELGPLHLLHYDRDAHSRRLVRRLERLGLRVTLEPLPEAA